MNRRKFIKTAGALAGAAAAPAFISSAFGAGHSKTQKIGCLFSSSGAITTLRVLRVLRVLRLLKSSEEIRLIGAVLVRSLNTLIYNMLFFCIFLYLFAVIGVILGTVISANLHTKSLVLFFSIVLYFLAFNIFFIKEKTDIKKRFTLITKIILGFISGFVSSLMGIGGAIINVPILKYSGFTINKAIGSAAAIGFLIALCGALGFLISGTYLKVNLPLSVGFINIPAFLIIVPITTFMAKIGANTMHKIDKSKVSKLFGIFLLIVATKFLYNYFNI